MLAEEQAWCWALLLAPDAAEERDLRVMDELTIWQLRSTLKSATREFFAGKGYLELDTPIAVPCPGAEVHLRYFASDWLDHQGVRHGLWLRSSPELHLKKALVLGVPKVFELARCFRNGGELADWHHPEFTMLEWYETSASFTDLLATTEALVRHGHAALAASLKRLGRAMPMELPATFPRIGIFDAFERFAGIELHDQDPTLAAKAIKAGIESVRTTDDFETAYFKVLLDCVEPAIARLPAVFLVDYPPSQAALAELATVGGRLIAKRGELYLGRVELANGFQELVDPAENRRRFAEQRTRRLALGFECPENDEEFFRLLERGMPPSCGMALGFDRWLACLLGERTLDRVLPLRTSSCFHAAQHGDSFGRSI